MACVEVGPVLCKVVMRLKERDLRRVNFAYLQVFERSVITHPDQLISDLAETQMFTAEFFILESLRSGALGFELWEIPFASLACPLSQEVCNS